MAGKTKKKIYQYDSNYKYMRLYESQVEVFDKYYDGKKGDMFQGKQYKELPDGTFVSWYRIGRKGLRYHVRKDRCPFCSKNKTDRPFSAYNMDGEKVASFENIRIYQALTGGNGSEARNSLYNSDKVKGYQHTSQNNLRYKWDDVA